MTLTVGELTAYLTVDNDQYKRGLREARGDLNVLAADAKKSGDSVGKSTEGMVSKTSASVSRLLAAVEKARRREVDATDAVKLAELRLNEARNKGGRSASAMLALEQRLTKAQRDLADATIGSARATDLHAAALARLGDDTHDVERSGEKVGGKLAQGINQGLIRNSPLIVAGIAGALTVGAPAVLAGATGLFSGIGIVAAAQADDVQSAWLGAWQNIKRSTISEASAIEPVLIGLADRVSTYFDAMQHRLGQAFEDAAPQIEVFADGVMDLASNALPGLFRAVERGMPVTQGLAEFLGDVGTGLSDFFDTLADHAPAAGRAFAALGDIMGELLPILGEVLGQGAELASIVLPPLAKALGVVGDVADALGPLLPPIVAGFAALKIAQAATGWVGGFGDKLASLKSSLTPTNVALGVLAVSVGVAMTAIKDNNDLTQSWVDGLNAGGEAARAAAEEMHAYASSNDDFELIGRWIGENLGLTESVEDVTAAHQEYLNSLTPVQWAQRDAKIATEELDRAIKDFGRNSPEAAAALDEYRAATARTEERQAALEIAISGVTEAMAAQRDAVIASFDSQLAYEESLDRLETAQKDYGDAVAEFGPKSEEARDAHLALRDGINATADAFANAQGDVSGLQEGTAAYDEFVRGQFLKSLYMMREEAGPGMKAALDQMITSMQNAGIETQSAAEIAEQFGVQLNDLDGINASPSVSLEADGFNAVLGGAVALLNDFGLAKAVPTADLNDNPLQAGYNHDLDLLSILTGQKPTPVANLNDGPFSGIFSRVMDRVGTIAGQRPVPVVNANDGPFTGIFSRVMSRVGTLAGQRPTPQASLIDRVSSAVSGIVSRLNGIPNISRTVTITTINRQLTQSGIVPPQRAAGGPVWPGQEFLVGEQGPELVRFPDRGTVIPAGQTAAILSSREAETPRVRALSGTTSTSGAAGSAAGFTAAGNAEAGRALHVHFDGPVLADKRSLRKTAEALHTEFRAIERART